MDINSIKLYIIIAVLIILAALAAFITGRKKQLPYVRAEDILTKNERDCYALIRKFADENGFDVFCKVRFADIVNVRKNTENYMTWFNKIKSKHIDFTICQAYKSVPVLLIELDDRSHENPDRIERDKFVDDVCRICDIPIIHIYRSDFKNIDSILKEQLQK